MKYIISHFDTIMFPIPPLRTNQPQRVNSFSLYAVQKIQAWLYYR